MTAHRGHRTNSHIRTKTLLLRLPDQESRLQGAKQNNLGSKDGAVEDRMSIQN